MTLFLPRRKEESWCARPRSFHGISNEARRVATGQVGGSARSSLASPRRLGHVDHSRPHLPLRTPIRTCRGFAGRLVELCIEGPSRAGEALCAIAWPPFAAGLEHAWPHSAHLCHPLHGSSPCVGISQALNGSKPNCSLRLLVLLYIDLP